MTGTTYREYHENKPATHYDIAPWTPGITPVHLLSLNLPTTELLIQPPPVRAVPKLDVRQPLARNRYNGRIHANAYT